MTNGNNDDDDRHDLTRIEDLSEFLHEEDPELEDKFGGFSTETTEGTSTDVATGLDLDELDAAPEIPDEDLPALPDTTISEMDFSDSDEVEESTDSLADSLDDSPFELSNDAFDSVAEVADVLEAEAADDFSPMFDQADEEVTEEAIEEASPDKYEHIAPAPMEKFEEVKNFAQNFSYGQIQGGGNPPFSLVIRNLKYEDDAEDIINILQEFGLVTAQNLEETQKALELGSLLVPQVSEYSAIVLAHKFRRFDCDLEVGLSDEVHPSKSGEFNPRGLMKKDSLRQNITQTYKSDEEETPSKGIIVSTTPSLEGYVIKKFIGVQTSFTIVDEEELERLKFVQEKHRVKSEMHHYETDDPITSERAFKDYQNSFEYLFTDLSDQLKAKAMKEKANALLGLNYQLTSLPFEKSDQGGSRYQLLCSATLAVVKAEQKK